MMMGAIWFTLGSVVGAYMAGNTTAKLAAGAARASLGKLNTVPEPCRSQAIAALTSFSQADLARAELEMFGASPEDAQAAVEKMNLPPGPLMPPEGAPQANVSEQQIIDELHLTPEQIGQLRSLRTRYRSAPGKYTLTDEDLTRELHLSAEQRTTLRMHARTATPAPPPLPAAPPATETAGYEFPYSPYAYYDPYAYLYGFALEQPTVIMETEPATADHPYHRYWNHMSGYDPHWHQRENGWRMRRHWDPSWGQQPPEPPPL